MKRFIAILTAAAALSAPAVTLAQGYPGGFNMPPQVAAQMKQAHDKAKTASYNALSADHRSKVQAVVTQFTSGSIDREQAASQIDGILTPSEAQAVLAQQKIMRDTMRTAMQNSGMSPPPMMGGGMGHRPGGQRTPDAGRFLLMISVTPDQMRQMGAPH